MDLLRHATRVPGVRGIWRRFPVGKVTSRVTFGIWERPHYAYGVFSAASMAVKLGLRAVTVVEFGVAGGRGLLALEDCAMRVGAHLGIEIAVYGFDMGTGLPSARDYRDLPHVWGEGDYQMNFDKLQARLRKAKLLIGDVADTVPQFLKQISSQPIGFVSFDMDYYSSTKSAFQIFDGPVETRLPRVYCYFDDIVWPEEACHNEYAGEFLAINEFNAEHAQTKICKLANLRWMQPHPAQWHEQIYIAHDFQHPLYSKRLRATEENHLDL